MVRPKLQIIGVLHGDITHHEDAPKNFDESERIGTLEIYPEFQEGLEGIVPGQTIVVLSGFTSQVGTFLRFFHGEINQKDFVVSLPPAVRQDQIPLRSQN